MHEVPSCSRRVILVSAYGENREYSSYYQLITTATDYIYRNIGNSYDELMKTPTGRPAGYIYWIAHWDNGHGEIIDASRIRSDIWASKYKISKGLNR